MSEPQTTLLSRIGSWFSRSKSNGSIPGRTNGDLPLHDELHGDSDNALEPRSSFLRPWARRDAAINNLQDGFNTLTELMSGIKDGIERQNDRQTELMRYLSTLPQVIEMLPESQRVQGETLKAIHSQIEHQGVQQERLASILERLGAAGVRQNEKLEEISERLETFQARDEKIAQNLQAVGNSMSSVSQTSSASAQVLQQLRDNIESRDGQLERILHKQNVRFTTMLSIAIFLSIAALVAVSIVGYLLILKHG